MRDETGPARAPRRSRPRCGPATSCSCAASWARGKTAFVRHAAAALGVTGAGHAPDVHGRAPLRARGRAVAHLDLYRSRGVTVEELGDLEEYLDEAAIVFVEWPEAGVGVLPPPTVRVEIDDLGEAGARSIAIDRP